MNKIEKKEKTLVSVIVPVYNAEEYLEQCIDSLLAQTYQNLEIILVDDGSTDNSLFVCKRYEDISSGKINVVHKENGGVSSARNLGISLARGKYLIFVDADDRVHQELVEIYMEANENQDVLICGFSDDCIDLEKKYIQAWRSKVKSFSAQRFMELFAENYINPPWNKLYHADILRDHHICFREDRNLGEDLLFNLEYLQYAASEYKLLQCPLYYYQENHEGSLSCSFKSNLFDLQLELFRELESFLKKQCMWGRENQNLYFQIFWDRLYLTVQIYRNQIKTYEDTKMCQELKNVLNHSIWKWVEQECKKRNLMKWKRTIKKWHLTILRRYVNRSDLCI